MDNLSILLFTVTSLSLLGGALWLMWSASTSEPMKNYRTGTWTTQVVKRVHPEMEGVKTGEELLVFTPEEDEEDDDDGDIPTYR